MKKKRLCYLVAFILFIAASVMKVSIIETRGEDVPLLPGPILKADYYVTWSGGPFIIMECTSGYYNKLKYVYELSDDGVNFKNISDQYADEYYKYEIGSKRVSTDYIYVRVKQTGTILVNGVTYQGTKYSNVVQLFTGTPSMDIYSNVWREQSEDFGYLPIGSEVQFYTRSGSDKTVWSATEISGEPLRWDVIDGDAAEGCTITSAGLLKIDDNRELIGKKIRISTHLPYDIDPLCDYLPYDTKVIELTEHTKEIEILYKGSDGLNGDMDNTVGMKPGQSRQFTAKIKPQKMNYNGVLWKSGDEKVATVNQNGMVTAVGRGETEIIATTSDRRSSSVYVIVDMAIISSDKITIHPCEIAENYVSLPKYMGKVTKWKVKNKKIVKIKKTYSYGGVRFVGLKAGKTKITTSIGGVTYGFEVVVKNPRVFKLQYKKIALKPGGDLVFNNYRTHSRDADGFDRKLIKAIVSNKKVAKVTVDEDGIEVESKAKGKTKVTVKAGKKKAVFWVTVK